MSLLAHIALRPVEPADLPLFFEHQCDPIAVAMADFKSRDRAAFDQHWAKILANPTGLIRTVVATFDGSPESAAGGEVVGNIVSWDSDGKRELGYWIDRTYWGRGLATGALSAFLRLEQTRPIYASAAKHNVASLRVLQKCGFQFHNSDGAAADSSGDSHLALVLTAD